MSLADAFNGLQKPARDVRKSEVRPAEQAKAITLHAAAPRAPLPLQGVAKSQHPDYKEFKAYLRKDTRTAAARRFEDAGRGDFSDLVQWLLEEYVGGRLG